MFSLSFSLCLSPPPTLLVIPLLRNIIFLVCCVRKPSLSHPLFQLSWYTYKLTFMQNRCCVSPPPHHCSFNALLLCLILSFNPVFSFSSSWLKLTVFFVVSHTLTQFYNFWVITMVLVKTVVLWNMKPCT
jgi:hypothetical protein